MNLSDIQIRDPYILPVESSGMYYLYGTTDKEPWGPRGVGFDCYRSKDLQNWEGPIEAFRPRPGFWATRHYWAPEVHAYKSRYFMFASFVSDERLRGTQILVADKPEGPFELWSDGPVTPEKMQALDGTLHIDDEGKPWMVFCHEWVQVLDGAMVAMRLSDDLKQAEGEPVALFHASAAPWVNSFRVDDPKRLVNPDPKSIEKDLTVTDGPFLHRTSNGTLLMLWSSFGKKGYAMGLARSESGNILGPWVQDAEPLWAEDGGHGMFFRTFDGDLYVTLHQPNNTPNERAAFYRLVEMEDGLRLA